MGMKLWCQLPAAIDISEGPAEEGYGGTLSRLFQRVARADTQIDVKPAVGAITPDLLEYPGLRHLNDGQIIRSGLGAGQGGYDALVVTCFFDPGLEASKQLLAIPVVGICQSTLLLASTMGRRFAIITSDPTYIGEVDDNIDRYHLRDQVISQHPVRTITLSSERFFGCLGGDYDAAVESFTAVAKGAIADGAEVLIAGCGLLSPMLTDRGVTEIDGIPLIDPLVAGVKMAESLVDMQRAGLPVISRAGRFQGTPAEAVERALAQMDG
ncbi:MAG: aspartate/glutamate racemase family protein [Gammaproteobacteria bacterium]|nr:aspartate/glutamate racemase family protein [Gammaproteobacteria bacterium]